MSAWYSREITPALIYWKCGFHLPKTTAHRLFIFPMPLYKPSCIRMIRTVRSNSDSTSFAFTKHQGYRMSTATPLDQSLQRTISPLNLQTIKEDMEDKELLIIRDQNESAEASPTVAEANDGSLNTSPKLLTLYQADRTLALSLVLTIPTDSTACFKEAKLDECLEEYIFPATEEKIWEKPPSKPPPVLTRSRSQSQSSRGTRGGYNNRGSRHGQYGNRAHGGHASRRASTSSMDAVRGLTDENDLWIAERSMRSLGCSSSMG